MNIFANNSKCIFAIHRPLLIFFKDKQSINFNVINGKTHSCCTWDSNPSRLIHRTMAPPYLPCSRESNQECDSIRSFYLDSWWTRGERDNWTSVLSISSLFYSTLPSLGISSRLSHHASLLGTYYIYGSGWLPRSLLDIPRGPSFNASSDGHN